MFVHARDELYDSPAGRRLLDDIGDLWIAADAFTAAVSFDSIDARRVEAGLLTLPDLDGGFRTAPRERERHPRPRLHHGQEFLES